MALYQIGNSELDLNSWEEIILSLITHTDKVWVPIHLKVSDGIEERMREHLVATLINLKESKIINTWAFEFNKYENKNIEVEANRIITLEEHFKMRETIDGLFSNVDSRDIQNNKTAGIERTSKFIDYRNDLWNILIGDLCKANGFITRKNENLNFLTDKTEEYKHIYFNRMFEKFQIKNLWSLNTEQIIKLRKEISKTRIDLNDLTKNKMMHIDNLETVFEEDINMRYNEYQETINEIIDSNIGKSKIIKDFRNTIINIYGIFLWPLSFIPLFEDSVGNYLNRRRNGFITYMTDLKRITKS